MALDERLNLLLALDFKSRRFVTGHLAVLTNHFLCGGIQVFLVRFAFRQSDNVALSGVIGENPMSSCRIEDIVFPYIRLIVAVAGRSTIEIAADEGVAFNDHAVSDIVIVPQYIAEDKSALRVSEPCGIAAVGENIVFQSAIHILLTVVEEILPSLATFGDQVVLDEDVLGGQF